MMAPFSVTAPLLYAMRHLLLLADAPWAMAATTMRLLLSVARALSLHIGTPLR